MGLLLGEGGISSRGIKCYPRGPVVAIILLILTVLL